MPSDVGKQTQEYQVIEHAVALEMDCIAAYAEAAKQLENGALHDDFVKLVAECTQHVQIWQQQLQEIHGTQASANRLSFWLNKTKVQVVAPFGQRAIAFAVTNNPADCVTAYERVVSRQDLRPITRKLASQMLEQASLQREVVRDARR